MNAFEIDTGKTVLVTGATGYMAGWIVRDLLAAGVNVNATVRDPDDAAKVGHLTTMGDELPGTLTLFKADLLQDGAFDAAMEGCAIVFHTASPYTLAVSDPQTELVDPALVGTRNVLGSVNRNEGVERVVLTSSCAAIYGDSADCADAPNGILTEEVWNSTSSLDHTPYSYSKTLAERAAWDIADAQDRWCLVVMNPGGIYGPAVGGPIPTSESFNIIRQIGGGAFKPGLPHFESPKVDVRDVSDAHLRGAYLPDAQGRHMLFEKPGTLMEMADAIRAKYPNAPLPSRNIPKWLIWFIGPIMSKGTTRKFIARGVNHAWRGDNSKSRNALGLTYRDTTPGIVEMHEQIEAARA